MKIESEEKLREREDEEDEVREGYSGGEGAGG